MSAEPGTKNSGVTPNTALNTAPDADSERRFGGLRRLYGAAHYARIRAAHIVVIGVGGVGSWCAEALARSGVARLTLIDMDHVSESNINRQVQALGTTLGIAKVEALRQRIADIHPSCQVIAIDEFATETNWPQLLSQAPAVDVVIDACDQVRSKAALAAWALQTHHKLVIAGAAGGKRQPQAVQTDDLSLVTHDPLLASLRQRLRKLHGAARGGKLGLQCVYSREAVAAPEAALVDIEPPASSSDSDAMCEITQASDGSLNCHGYGSSVSVTATFGMVAASVALEWL
jgi:tRNA threonylcarbamoyladenosine dehydratase